MADTAKPGWARKGNIARPYTVLSAEPERHYKIARGIIFALIGLALVFASRFTLLGLAALAIGLGFIALGAVVAFWHPSAGNAGSSGNGNDRVGGSRSVAGPRSTKPQP